MVDGIYSGGRKNGHSAVGNVDGDAGAASYEHGDQHNLWMPMYSGGRVESELRVHDTRQGLWRCFPQC